MEVRFTVWQFVRLMVRLEDDAARAKDAKALLNAWADVWAPLDADLARLATDDPDAYSELMMDQELVIDNATPSQIAGAKATLEAVMDDMDAAIDAGNDSGGEDDLLDSLKFERRELRQLTRKLGRMIEKA